MVGIGIVPRIHPAPRVPTRSGFTAGMEVIEAVAASGDTKLQEKVDAALGILSRTLDLFG